MFEHLLAKPKVHDTVINLLRAFTDKEMKSGDRLPTVRQLADDFDVSIYTIHTAISELKDSGYVESHGRSLNFLSKLPAQEEFIDLKGVVITTLVPDYNDLRKLNSMLIREQSHVAFRAVHPEIEIKEIQTKGQGTDFSAEQIKQLMRNGIPTTNNLTQTELPIYQKFNLITPINEELVHNYLKQIKPQYTERCRINGKLYMLPTSITASCYTYNHKLLAAAGIDAEYCFSGLAEFVESLRLLHNYTGKPPLIFTHAADLYMWLQHLVACNQKIITSGQQLPPLDWQSDYCSKALEYFFNIIFEEKLGIINTSAYEDNILSLYDNEIPIVFDSGTLASFLMGHRQTANYSLAQLGTTGLGNVSGNFIRIGADEREHLAAIKYIMYNVDWVHKDAGGICRASYNRFSKPWSIYKDIENDRFLCKDSNFPEAWREAAERIESDLIWEPLGNDWEKFLTGRSLQKLLESERNVTVDALKFYLNSVNAASVSGEQLTQIMALA